MYEYWIKHYVIAVIIKKLIVLNISLRFITLRAFKGKESKLCIICDMKPFEREIVEQL